MKSRAKEKAAERAKHAAGFVHVAGWVRAADAPAIRRKIEAAREDVEKVKRDADMTSAMCCTCCVTSSTSGQERAMIDIEHLKRVRAAATDGPWTHLPHDDEIVGGNEDEHIVIDSGCIWYPEDAALIALAPTLADAYIAQTEALRLARCIATDAQQMCKDGHPVSAMNVAASILAAIDAILKGGE